jgi:hypothetical protein
MFASRYPRFWLALALALATSSIARDACSQAGIEAAAATKQAAEWAKRQKEAGADATVQPRVIQGARSAQSGSASGGGRAARKPSGAPGRLSGRVIERGTRSGVPGVLLSLTSTDPQYVVVTHLASTDSTGAYRFPEIEPGHWALAVVADRIPATYGAVAADRAVTVARNDSLVVFPIELFRTACVEGHTEWSDGYVFSDGSIVVAPHNPSFPALTGKVNGVGDFQICSAPADTAMVWLLLRDGRRFGQLAQLSVGHSATVEFRPEPLEQMKGTQFHLRCRTSDGTPVPQARVVLVGRRIGVGKDPWTVFAREVQTDRVGEAITGVPYGTYEILALNPRQGSWARVQQFVVARGVRDELVHELVLHGTSSEDEQIAWRNDLLARADQFLYRWVP